MHDPNYLMTANKAAKKCEEIAIIQAEKEWQNIVLSINKAMPNRSVIVPRIKNSCNRDQLEGLGYITTDLPANGIDYHSTVKTKIEW